MMIRCLCATAACCLGLSGAAAGQTQTAQTPKAPTSKAPTSKAKPASQAPSTQPGSSLVSDATVRPDEPTATSPVEEKDGFFKSLLASINSDAEGWTPSVGNVVSGSGLAFGSHYRQPLADGRLFMDTEFMLSLKGYQSATMEFTSRPLANGRVTVGGGIRFEGLPQEDFFGYGPESNSADHASYHRQGLDTQGWVAFAPKPWLQFRSSFGFVNTKVSEGRQSGIPSLEDAFAASRVEGMSRESDFLHAGLRATIDRRDSPKNTRRGAYYAVGLERFVGLGSRDSDFLRFDADVRGYVPVRGLSANDSIAVRGQMAITDAAASGQIPFYFLPRLGGGGTLRGYESSRFVDQQAVVFSAEYRWQLRRKLQIVGFVDAGQVAPDRHDFSFSRLQSSYGAGIRFKGFRVDYAVGREGSRVHIGFGPTF
jgi:outer membrane protein assembly factor BamA